MVTMKEKLKGLAECIPTIGKPLAFLIDLFGHKVVLILVFGIVLGGLFTYWQIVYKKRMVPLFTVSKIQKYYCAFPAIQKSKTVPWSKPKEKLYPIIRLLPDTKGSTTRLETIIQKQLIDEGSKRFKQTIDDFNVIQVSYEIKNRRDEFEFVGQVERKSKCSLSGEAFLYKSGTDFELFEHLTADKQSQTLKFKIKKSHPGDKIVAIIKIEKKIGAGRIDLPKKTIDWFAQ